MLVHVTAADCSRNEFNICISYTKWSNRNQELYNPLTHKGKHTLSYRYTKYLEMVLIQNAA